MATLLNIQSALSFPANPETAFIKNGRTIGAVSVARMRAWFEATYRAELTNPAGIVRPMTADDLSAWLWRQLSGAVMQYERRVAEQGLATPLPLTE